MSNYFPVRPGFGGCAFELLPPVIVKENFWKIHAIFKLAIWAYHMGKSQPRKFYMLACMVALTLLVGQQAGHLACKKTEWWDVGVVVWDE